MNFSIHLDDRLAASLKREASRRGRPRNALVTEAVRQWLEREQKTTWPQDLVEGPGFPELEPFEAHRSKKARGARFP